MQGTDKKLFLRSFLSLFISTSALSYGDLTDFRSWRAGDMAAQNFKEEDWGDGDTIGQKISKRGAR